MKESLIADISMKAAEAVMAKLKEGGLGTVEQMKKFVLETVESDAGANLKGLVQIITQGILQQVPKGSLFAPDHGREFNPEIGLMSLPSERLESLKRQMEALFTPRNSWTDEHKSFFNGSKKDLQIQVGQDGGFLVPQEFISEVQRRLVKISTFRSWAKAYNGVGMKGSLPRETGSVVVGRKLEAIAMKTSQFSVGEVTWGLNPRFSYTELTRELFLFSGIDVLTLLATMFSEQNQKYDDQTYMVGTGKDDATGLLVETKNMNITSQTGSSFDWTDVAKLEDALPVQYRIDGNCGFIMTHAAKLLVKNLKDDVNRPIYQDRGKAGIASTNLYPTMVGELDGYPVMEDNFIPTVAGATTIIFGNLKRGYVVFEKGSIETKTSEEAGDLFIKNKMAVRSIGYDDGKPNIPEAIALMTGVKA